MTSTYEKLEGELMKAIIFGPPGSGKGTYASYIQEKLGTIKVSTGDIVREEERKGTELGKIMKKYKDKGILVPDEIIIDALKKRIFQPDCKEKGFILDGYPRTIPQAEALKKITEINIIINLDIPNEIIIDRLSNRRLCRKEGCPGNYNLKYNKPKTPGKCDICDSDLYQRIDDRPDEIAERLREYEKKTQPVLQYLEECYKGKAEWIDFKPRDWNDSPEVNAGQLLEELKKTRFYKQ